MKESSEITDAEKILRHYTEDHKFNEIKFGFIEITSPHLIITEEGSGLEMTITAAMSLFLVSSLFVICMYSSKRSFIVDQFLFASGFKSSVFQPPKFFS